MCRGGAIRMILESRLGWQSPGQTSLRMICIRGFHDIHSILDIYFLQWALEVLKVRARYESVFELKVVIPALVAESNKTTHDRSYHFFSRVWLRAANRG